MIGIERKHSSVATIAAELQDGSRIVGQNDISHPHQGMANDIAVFEGQPMLLVRLQSEAYCQADLSDREMMMD